MSENKAPASSRELEDKVIAFFVDVVRAFGAPRSLGAIYGFLFVSSQPATFDDVVARLKISTGSASQGLRFLKAIGAIDVACVPGEKRDRFVAETRLGQIILGIYRGTLEQQLANRENQFQELLTSVRKTRAHGSFWDERITLLENWRDQFQTMKGKMLEIVRGASPKT